MELDERSLAVLRLPTIDDELAAVWPRLRRYSTGVSPDVERVASMLSAGVYAPLRIDANDVVVDPDGETILEAARLLGWTTVQVTVAASVADPVVLLAAKLARDHYPTSRILAIMTSPVFWQRYARIIEAARGRMLNGAKAATTGRSRDLVATSIGMKGKGRALQTVLRARRILGDDFVDAIARGESSLTIDNLDRAVKASGIVSSAERAGLGRLPGQRSVDSPWRLVFSDLWLCKANTGDFGLADFRGGAPDEIVAHLVERWSAEGDLVVDPMAGSGRTVDIATRLKRRVVASDQLSRRPDIVTHRIECGPIPGVGRGKADLVVLDPPYFDMMADHYGVGSSSNLPWADFSLWLRAVAKSAFTMTRRGGFAGTLTMNVRGPDGSRRMLRREFERAMEEAGWTPVDELVAGTPHWPHADEIQRARLQRVPLSKSIYVGIWRR